MNKSIICLALCLFLTGTLLKAQDTTARQPRDTATQIQDSAARAKDSAARFQDSVSKTQQASATPAVQDNARQIPEDPKPGNAQNREGYTRREVDTRWFIAPLTKLQFQDFAMLEKDRKGYLSDANTLPFPQRGNGSFAASAYKNITGRLSISADLGLSFGHCTNDSVLISKTQSKTYNLLNATLFYHLLNASFRLQPFISIGFNDIIADASYMTAPIGIGAKFNSKHIMVMGQVAYGYALSSNVANNTMYSLGVYIPIRNRKSKMMDSLDNSPANKTAKDTSGKKVINNFYITIKMDSVLNARNAKNNDDATDAINALAGGSKGGHKKGGGTGGDGSDNMTDGSDGSDKPGLENPRIDTVNGKLVFKYFVYFEFNEYSLNSSAFAVVDRAIFQMRKNPERNILINGYADDIGTIPQNNFISRKRSQMVFEYMNSRGVASERMTPKFFGKQFPVADNDPTTSWMNRRVEIVVKEK
jgi:outer membrane protein OmpA-like peptidoglycan-associated protein